MNCTALSCKSNSCHSNIYRFTDDVQEHKKLRRKKPCSLIAFSHICPSYLAVKYVKCGKTSEFEEEEEGTKPVNGLEAPRSGRAVDVVRFLWEEAQWDPVPWLRASQWAKLWQLDRFVAEHLAQATGFFPWAQWGGTVGSDVINKSHVMTKKRPN